MTVVYKFNRDDLFETNERKILMNNEKLHKILNNYFNSPKGIESQQYLALELLKHIKQYGRCCYTISIEEELSRFLLNKFNDEDSFREFLKTIDKSLVMDNNA